MGAAGDMLSASLLELLPDREDFLRSFQALGIPGITVTAEHVQKCGITGTHFSVLCNGREEAVVTDTITASDSAEGKCDISDGSAIHTHQEQPCVTKSGAGAYAEAALNTAHTPAGAHGFSDEHHHGHTHGDPDEHHHDHTHGESDEHHHDHMHGDSDGHHHDHAHSTLHDIAHIVSDHLPLPDSVKRDVLAVYGLLAEAESHAHGVPVQNIHFHEVGSMDAIADITAFCLLIHELAPDEIIVSPVCTGSGQVRCAHGILPVPAPATAHLLRGIPTYSGTIREELCTPTGAALLKYFATRFGSMPVMCVNSIGYGMGKKDFPAANCVRAMLGETVTDTHSSEETVTELFCQVDDMTAEEIGFASDLILTAGALDFFTLPAGMKKSRPGTLICVLCRNEDRDAMLRLLFRHTSTLGIRENRVRRHTLSRSLETIRTEFGNVRKKTSAGFGISREKYEYDDIARIAREQNLTFRETVKILEAESEC